MKTPDRRQTKMEKALKAADKLHMKLDAAYDRVVRTADKLHDKLQTAYDKAAAAIDRTVERADTKRYRALVAAAKLRASLAEYERERDARNAEKTAEKKEG